MSDSAGKIFNGKEDFQVVLSKRDSGETSSPKHSRWMARWTKASNSAEPLDGKSCSSLQDANNGICTKDPGASPFEVKKSRVAERLMLGGNYERTFMDHVQQLNSKTWDVGHDGWQKSEQKEIEHRDGSFESSLMRMQMQKDVNSHATAVVSETFSVHRLSELSLDFQSQFPTLETNKNIDKILNKKRRSATGTVSNDLLVPQHALLLNIRPSNLTAFLSQVYELQSLRITDGIMDQCKPPGGIISVLEDPTFLISDPAGKKLKVDNNTLSDRLVDEQHIGHYFANPDQASPCRCSENKFNLSENNGKSQKVVVVSQSMKSRSPAGLHKQQDASGVVFSAPVLGTEHKIGPISYSKNSKQDDENFYVACPLISDKHHYLNTHRVESPANVTDSCMLPDPTANILTVNRKGDAVTHEWQPVDKFTDCIKQKGSCLFEMLTIPSKSQNAYPTDSLSPGKSSGFGVWMYGRNAGSNLFGAKNQFPPERLHGHAQYVSKSSESITSLLLQKDNRSADNTKPDQLATLSMKGSSIYNKENRLQSGNVNQYFPSKAAISSKQELCTPGTEIRDLDPLPFQLSRVRNQGPNGAIRLLPCTEPTDRWLKRLRHDVADPPAPSSKRPKIRNCHPAGGASGMSAPRDGRSDTEVDDHDAARSFHSWFGRWLQDGGDPALQEDPNQRKRAAATPDLPSGELEGRFPSIRAMAMMGRMMSKVRPFDHQRKGPWVMWKTDET